MLVQVVLLNYLFFLNDGEKKLPFTVGDRYITHLEISDDCITS